MKTASFFKKFCYRRPCRKMLPWLLTEIPFSVKRCLYVSALGLLYFSVFVIDKTCPCVFFAVVLNIIFLCPWSLELWQIALFWMKMEGKGSWGKFYTFIQDDLMWFRKWASQEWLANPSWCTKNTIVIA